MGTHTQKRSPYFFNKMSQSSCELIYRFLPQSESGTPKLSEEGLLEHMFRLLY